MGTSTIDEAPTLPRPRGPVSEAVVAALRGLPGARSLPRPVGSAEPAPDGEDLALALQTCYELHYRGFDGVDPAWEWDPELLRLRAQLERVFLSWLREELGDGDDVADTLDSLLIEPVPGQGVTHHLRDHGEWWQVQEFFAHRSIYHLKEADPHAWVIPRLQGQAKASLVAVEFDEFGGGRGERVHARLFADLMSGAGLDPTYLGYLDVVPASAITTVNLMSMFGLHRSLRGALVGHFTAAEISTAPAAQRMAEALRRLGAAPECITFYTEHVEADAVHEQLMRRDVIGDLLAREPQLAADVVFGIRATELLESRLAEHLLDSWQRGRSSLRDADRSSVGDTEAFRGVASIASDGREGDRV